MKLLGISGRKTSGKNTLFNHLLGIELLKLAVVREKMAIMDDGALFVSDFFGDTEYAGVFDITRNNEAMTEFKNEYVYPYIKNYSFADSLKQDVCIGLLGLTHEQCYGTDNDKNTKTKLQWEDMPGITTDKGFVDMLNTREVKARLGNKYMPILNSYITYHEAGHMTAREVMQYVGTDLFRRMYSDVWVNSTINRIKKEGSLFSVITDVRFPEELEAIKNIGGKVIRLTRGICDGHESETALDADKYDWNNFDAIIDNKDATIGQQNHMVLQMLEEWGWIDPVREE